MNAKEMCGFLKLKADLLAEYDGNNYAANNYREISDFITDQEKYAELGRLALEFLADKDYCSDACAISTFKFGVNDNCKDCWVFKICQKRAELLKDDKS
jgi:hypothetical protein